MILKVGKRRKESEQVVELKRTLDGVQTFYAFPCQWAGEQHNNTAPPFCRLIDYRGPVIYCVAMSFICQ